VFVKGGAKREVPFTQGMPSRCRATPCAAKRHRRALSSWPEKLLTAATAAGEIIDDSVRHVRTARLAADLQHVKGAANQWATVRRVAQKLQETGHESLWLYDHFTPFPRRRSSRRSSAGRPWPRWRRLHRRCGSQLATCSLYRNPAYL
jgi:hypothetical protein